MTELRVRRSPVDSWRADIDLVRLYRFENKVGALVRDHGAQGNEFDVQLVVFGPGRLQWERLEFVWTHLSEAQVEQLLTDEEKGNLGKYIKE